MGASCRPGAPKGVTVAANPCESSCWVPPGGVGRRGVAGPLGNAPARSVQFWVAYGVQFPVVTDFPLRSNEAGAGMRRKNADMVDGLVFVTELQ